MIIGLLSLLFLTGGFFLLITNSHIQLKLSKKFLTQLSAKTNTQISISGISIAYLSSKHLILKDLTIIDNQQDTLFYSKYTRAAVAKINLHELELKSIDFDQVNINLNRDSVGNLRLNSIIDSLNSSSSIDSSHTPFQFSIHELNISKANLTYAIDLHPKNNLSVTNFNTNIDIDLSDTLKQEFKIKSLSLDYRNQLKLMRGKAKIKLSKGLYSLSDASFQTQYSKLNIKECSLKQLSYTKLKNVKPAYITQISLNNSQISSLDLRPFVDAFKGPETLFNLSSQLSLSPTFIKMNHLKFNFNNTYLTGSLEMNDYKKIKNAFLFCSVDSLTTNNTDILQIVNSITNNPVTNEFGDLGKIRFTGNVSGFLTDLIANGKLETKQGVVSTDMAIQIQNKQLSFSGNIVGNDVNLGVITQGRIPFDSISMNTKVTASNVYSDSAEVNVTGDIKQAFINQHMYQHITINGQMTHHQFVGDLNINDANGSFIFKGEADLEKGNKILNFSAKGKDINLFNLHLLNKYPDGKLSFEVNSDLNGSNLNNIDGAVELSNLTFDNNGDTASIDNILFESNASSITIYSNVINGSLDGTYSFDHFSKSINHYLYQFIPCLFKEDSAMIEKDQVSNVFNYDLKLSNFNDILNTLKLNTFLADSIDILGSFNELTNHFQNLITIKNGSFSDQIFSDSLSLNIFNKGETLFCNLNIDNLRRKKYAKNKVARVSLSNELSNNFLSNVVNWNYKDSLTHQGAIKITSQIENENKLWKITTLTNSNQFNIGNQLWSLKFNKLEFSPNHFNIDHLALEDSAQALLMNGIMSTNESDHLDLSLNQIDLNYLVELFDIKHTINIAGMASGKIEIHQALKNPFAYSNLTINKLKFNEQPFDYMELNSEWVPDESKIHLKTKFVTNNKSVLNAEGYFDIAKNYLSLDAHLKDLPLTFLREYLQGVLQDIDGTANGNIQVIGPLNHIALAGGAMVHNASFNMDYLKINASFSDSIYLTPKGFSFPNIKIYDKEGNIAIFHGNIDHDAFSNMKFDLHVALKNFLSLNTTHKDNEIYYGKAYASGTCDIIGDESLVRIFANVSTKPRTHLYIPLDGGNSVSSNNFMTFTNKEKLTPLELEIKKYEARKISTPTYISLNLSVHATEDAKVEIVFDATTGAVMKGVGNGDIQMNLTPDGEFKMQGKYIITSGDYLFVLQNIVNKKFDVKKGGSITWTSSPYDALIDVDAEYRLKTSLSNLISDKLTAENSHKRVTVACGMNLTGNLMHPDVKFDITLPYSDNETQRMVSDVINTTEDVSKQVGYLLLFNQFYSTEQNPNSNNSGQETGQIAAVTASELLSNQLSNMLSRINDNVAMGVYYRPQDALNSQEVEVNMSTQMFNNRVSINGNVGYSEQAATSNNFIGDFDVEVKLNKSGKLLLKTYTHSNDYLLRNTSPTTQGIGFVFKEEFNSFSELLHKYHESLFAPPPKKTQNNNQPK